MKHAEKIVDEAQAAKSEGINFTEVMEGFMYIGDEIEDFTFAADVARAACNSARFYLSVHAWNTDTRNCPYETFIITTLTESSRTSRRSFRNVDWNLHLWRIEQRAIYGAARQISTFQRGPACSRYEKPHLRL